MPKTESEMDFELEVMMDDLGLPALLDKIAFIAREKAEHIRSSYDDRSLAAQWEKDALKIEKLAAKF